MPNLENLGNPKLICAIVSLIGIAAFLIFFCLTIWHRFFRKKYTRERFAFAALASCLSATLVTIGMIGGTAGIVQQILMVLHYFKEGEVLRYELGPFHSAMLVVLLFGWYLFCYRMFESWDGPVSRETHLASRADGDNSLQRFIVEAFIELERIRTGSSFIEPYSPPSRRPEIQDFSKIRDSLPWRILARNLLAVTRNALDFDEGWRNEHRFWLATHKDHHYRVAVKCATDIPPVSELESFLDYLSKMSPSPQKMILAVESPVAIEPLEFNGQSIEIISKSKLINNLVDFTEYWRRIRKRATEEKLRETELTTHQTYVKPRFHIGKDALTSSQNIEDAIHDWVDDEVSQKQLAVLGEYGQGKSTLALMLTYHMLEQGIENIDGYDRFKGLEKLPRIPILLELRGKNPGIMSRGDLLAAWSHIYGIHSAKLEALHEAGRLLFIFDGFDEMELVGNPEKRIKHFETLWDFNHQNAKLIFTGRPNLFLDTNELRAALCLSESSSGKPTCEAWYLEKFNVEEISQALRNTPSDIRDGIIQAVQNNDRLYDIASRPSLLHVISVLWDDEIQARASQLTSAEVMERFITSSLKRQTDKANEILQARETRYEDEELIGRKKLKHSDQNYMVINYKERRYFMLGIAVHMMKKGETNQIDLIELNEVIENLAKVCPEEISRTTDAGEGNAKSPILIRIQESDDFLDRLKDDVRTCGLIVKDVEDKKFKFSHKSFLEYLAADFAERSYAGDDGIDNINVFVISSTTDTKFHDVLVNDVVINYFGELLIWKRSHGQLPVDNPTAIAELLLNKIIKPGIALRFVFSVSSGLLGYAESKFLTKLANLRNIFFTELSLFCLCGFSKSSSDREIHNLRISLITFLLLTVTLLISVTFIILYLDSSSIQVVDPLIFVALGGCSGALFILLDRANSSFRKFSERSRSHRLLMTWVGVCREQGCRVGHLYSALANNLDFIGDMDRDPVGMYTPKHMDIVMYERESNEVLQCLIREEKASNLKPYPKLVHNSFILSRLYLIFEAPSAWNIKAAAWVLARRHSKLGAILLSVNLNGETPVRDPRAPIDGKTIRQAMREAMLPQEKWVDELESLNSFLGWDLRKGLLHQSDGRRRSQGDERSQ